MGVFPESLLFGKTLFQAEGHLSPLIGKVNQCFHGTLLMVE